MDFRRNTRGFRGTGVVQEDVIQIDWILGAKPAGKKGRNVGDFLDIYE